MYRDVSIAIPDSFQGLHPNKEVRIYYRNLPHWRQEGATYFVTFRLADSLPQAILAELKEEAEWWRKRFLDYQESGDPIPAAFKRKWHRFLRRHFARLETGLDRCHGACPFRNPENREILAEAIRFFSGDRYNLSAAIVMPNHCHVAIQPKQDWRLEKILRSWKSFTTRRVNDIGGGSGSLWQPESYDRIIRDEDHYRKVVRYIIENPSKANLPNGQYALMLDESLGVEDSELEVEATIIGPET